MASFHENVSSDLNNFYVQKFLKTKRKLTGLPFKIKNYNATRAAKSSAS